ncbi:M20/M25/M40 family metallo-hydrolase [Trinickia sp. LjRoot230]|uniref:M20/M25/M40 family metallo-hydrolase n=1 Tax=Trinickia sp. LjRoot230 TaxID=3342288 RepID=UPI003ECE6E3D
MQVDIAELIRQLVAINSANPATCSWGAGEGPIATFCCEWLGAHGVRAALEPLAGRTARPALIARHENAAKGAHLLLLGHLDTYTWYAPHPTDDRRRIRGPGAFDMKGGVAAILCAMVTLVSKMRGGTVTALLVPDEEHASFGVRSLAPRLKADGAIVAEGTSADIGTHHDGRMRIFVETNSPREREMTILALAAMVRCGQEALRGVAVASSDGSSPQLVLQRRLAPGEDVVTILCNVEEILHALGIQKMRSDVREPFIADEDGALCECIRTHARRYALSACSTSVQGWTEAGVLSAAGIPCVVFGPHGDGAHTVDEWVDADSAADVSNAMADAAIEFCRF